MDKKLLIIILIVICLMWLAFAAYLLHYGEAVRKHPCSVCAEKLGEDITCIAGMEKVKFTEDKIKYESNAIFNFRE